MEESLEHKITINLEKLSRFINALLVIALITSGAFIFFYPSVWINLLFFLLFILNGLNFYYRHIQKKHTLLANFGILAQIRYFIESLGPEFRQYLYSSDMEGRPFNRVDRSDIYRKSKDTEKSAAFGSLLNFDDTEMKLKHSMFPISKSKIQKFSLTFGEERNLKTAYTITQPIIIGAMSYGALGKKAVRALSRGARKANIPLNTGEGGFPKYHLMENCDLIFQMGTAKFGVRTKEGLLDSKLLAELSQKPQVKMIEIKFSQGAKPGKGGILPKEKITKEISELRGVEMGSDVISPPRHQECTDPQSTCFFIKKIQDISGLPVGVKLCLGQIDEFCQWVQSMKDLNIFPDYIAIDGAEGGTGAAPKIFMDHVGWPVLKALPLVHQILEQQGVRDKMKVLASGKLINSGKQIMALSMGADAISTARGFMLALGCIQALRCNNNSCPVGITTHSPKLEKGLDIEEKSERIKNYVHNLKHDYYEIMSSLGQKSFQSLNNNLILSQDNRFLEEKNQSFSPPSL